MGLRVLLAALIATCAGPVGQPEKPSPAVATPTASPLPGRIPGTVVGLTVNGKSHPISQPVGTTGDLPTVVVLTFPMAVERASVEQWIPPDVARSWPDDRTLRLTFDKAGDRIAFKVPETRAAAGGTVIEWFTVDITFPEARLIRIYAIADLTGGARVPTPSSSVRAPAGDGLALAPDGRTAIVFDGISQALGPAPTLFDLDTKAATPLAQPPASDGWFSFVDWLPDGGLVMVGRSVWVGDARGTALRRIADAQAAVGGYPWVAVPDPAGKRIALWGYNTDGHIAVVDLADGSIRRITGPFRRSAADGAVPLAWSADGTRLAGTDNDQETGHRNARVRIVDVGSDRTVRTLEGNVHWLTGLPIGEIVVMRPSGETGAGARNLGLRMDFDLVEKARYMGCGWSMSPDRRYLLQSECGGAGYPAFTLTDLGTGASHRFGLEPGEHRWLRDGRLAVY